jgi:hypothetical protein
MSCRRARRELGWLVQFGEFDQGSAPHLDHLAGCRACREEIGIDRALVRQLRSALAARVEDAAPSPTAWEGVLVRMRQPEPHPSGLRTWVTRLAAGLRAGTAMAGASLALVLALNLEVVPVAPAPSPESGIESAVTRPAWAGEVPPFVDVAPPAAPAVSESADSVASENAVGIRPAPPAEQLPLGRTEAATASVADSEPVEASTQASGDTGWQVLAVRLMASDAARIAGIDTGRSEAPADEPEPVPVPPLQGPS